MIRKELAEIRERCEATSGPPWTYDDVSLLLDEVDRLQRIVGEKTGMREALEQPQEKQWGIADEAMMADIERRLWAAVDASCVGEELELKGGCTCPAHMVLRRFEEIPKPVSINGAEINSP
jgi:hypothetical protein